MIEDLATLLMNKTCMERFNKAEVESVLNFLMAGGYLVDPAAEPTGLTNDEAKAWLIEHGYTAPDPVVTIPRAELETVDQHIYD